MSKRPLHARFLDFFGGLYKSLRFSYHYIREKNKYGDYKYLYTETYKGKSVYILANGPSLINEIDSILSNGKILDDILVVNFFLESDYFKQIKPNYYCLADPCFNKREKLNDRTKNVYKVLNILVDWPMTLFVWNQAVDMVTEYIHNPYIKIKGLPILRFEGFEENRYQFYKKGIAVPTYINVTIMALYALLNLGYSTIFLYGVDHTFLCNLVVGDDNILYVDDKHFYGTNRVIADCHSDGTPWSVSEFVYDKYLTFVEHQVMRGYADYLGAQIINCTKGSWIDAYVRKAQIDKQSE